MVASGKVKSTYDLSVKVKHRLAILKADLRAANLSASESAIVEALIERADPGTLKLVFEAKKAAAAAEKAEAARRAGR